MGVNIDSSNIRELAADFDRVPNAATRRVGKAVETTAKQGKDLAKGFATASAGRHGKRYPSAITVESAAALGLSWKYGPEANLRQGGMSFEFGSRNQPPHLDKERSADIIVPKFYRDVDGMLDGLFW